MAFKINNDTYSANPNFDSISVSGSYHTISRIRYDKINHENNKNTTGETHIHMKLYKSSGSYAAGSGSYAKLNHIVNVNWTNNQNINWNDPDEEEDVAWENVNYNPNALTRLEQLGIMSPDILPEDKSYESYFDDRNLMAGGPKLLDPFQQLTNNHFQICFADNSLN